MVHIAIMDKSLHLTEKIIKGEKVIESRWYKNKSRPWDNIKRGDVLYIKNTGEPVSVYSEVSKVVQFEGLNQERVLYILFKYHKKLGFEEKDIPIYYERFKDKNYCIFVFLKRVKKIPSFKISKEGFGNQCAWICINSLEDIKLST